MELGWGSPSGVVLCSRRARRRRRSLDGRSWTTPDDEPVVEMDTSQFRRGARWTRAGEVNWSVQQRTMFDLQVEAL
jgi:hypothetical protein